MEIIAKRVTDQTLKKRLTGKFLYNGPDPMSQLLALKCLGGLIIEIDGRPVTRLVSQKAEVLLVYLACHPRPHSRELLATMLWDDRTQKQALSNLRTLLTSLRRHLKPYLSITRQTVSINKEADTWVDAVSFEQSVGLLPDGENAKETIALLEEALTLYRGDFLEGVFIDESRAVEMWMAQTRERLQRQALDVRRRLATHYLHRRQYRAALPHALRLVQADPLDEQGHRLLMRLLARDGQTGAAMAQFERCREILAEELNLAPDPQTVKLRDQIERIRQPIPHRLPPQFTPFVGREEELAVASRLLDDEECRLLTLLGVGGVGKTRLAIEIANERRGDYWHGISFVPLAGVDDAGGLVQAIANALEVTLQPQEPPEEQLLAALREREVLLVLDNFEQLVTASLDLIQTILKEAPDVQLLVTSRERLQLRAEWLMTLEGLTLSTPQRNGSPADRPASDAETLFEISARRMQSTFRLTEGQVTDVRHICELVDGLPLAIELAAGSLPAHTPHAVANKIRENLDFLSTTVRDVPERQRSLRATFDYSWSLLDSDAQATLAQLAVFRGEFGAEAAQVVTQANAVDLEVLCARSLLQQTGKERYSLHDALWQYALEKLKSDEAMTFAARRRHAHYYGELLQSLEADLDGGERQLEAVAAANRAWDNVAAGWRWAVSQGDHSLLDRYLSPLNQWLTLRGLYHEGLSLYRQAVEALHLQMAGGESDQMTKQLLGRLLSCQGFFQFRLMALEEAADSLRQSVRILSSLGEPDLLARPLSGLANIAFRQGRYEDAKKRYAQSLDLARQLEQPDRIAASLEGLAIVANFQGDLQEALRLLRQSLDLHRQVDDRHALANALGNLAATLMDLGRFGASLPYFEESIAIWRQLGDDYTRRIVLWNMGEAMLKLDRLQDAQDIFTKALQISEREGYPTGYSYWGLGEVHYRQEDYEKARRYTRRALAESSTDYERLRALFVWARLEAQAGRRARASTLLRLICKHPTTTALDREEAQAVLETVQSQTAGQNNALQDAPDDSMENPPSLDEAIAAILADA